MSPVSHDLPGGPILEQALPPLLFDWLPAQRWYRSKSRVLRSISLEAWTPLDAAGDCVFAAARTVFADGSDELYALPLVLKSEEEAQSLPESARLGSVSVGTENGTQGARVWCDASREPVFHRALYALLAGGEAGEKKIPLGGGVLSGSPLSRKIFEADAGLAPSAKLLSAEQSNTAFAYSSGRFAKLYRRLEAAVNPEPETLRFLRRAGYPHVPAFVSSLEWNVEGREPVTVALLQDWVSSRGDAWAYALEQLQAARAEGKLPASLLSWAATLGLRVAELHNALGGAGNGHNALARSEEAREENPFAPEPLLPADLARLRAGTLANLRATLASLEHALPRLAPETAALARAVLASAPRLEARLAADLEGPLDAMKIRTHGDLHLGQILVSSADPERIWILDFEGEPGRPLSEARNKHSPVRDAAGMMRSFHYAAHVALRDPALRPLAEEFSAALAHAFREAYFAALRVPVSRNPRSLLEAFMLEKAVYELNYELNNRPDWAEIPLLGLQHLVTDY